MTSTSRMPPLGPLAAAAALFGAIGPFASYTRAAIYHQLSRPLWTPILAWVLACVAAVVCVRVLSSKGGRVAMIVSVSMLIAPVFVGQWVPGLAVVGLIATTVLIPIFLIAIGLSQARGANSSVGVALLIASGSLAKLLVSRTLVFGSEILMRLPLPHIALGLGAIALAGTACAAWLLPWPMPATGPSLEAVARSDRLRIAFSFVLVVLSSLELDWLRQGSLGTVAMYLLQTVALRIAAALCILPIRYRHRAAVYLAVGLGGRFLGPTASMAIEWLR